MRLSRIYSLAVTAALVVCAAGWWISERRVRELESQRPPARREASSRQPPRPPPRRGSPAPASVAALTPAPAPEPAAPAPIPSDAASPPQPPPGVIVHSAHGRDRSPLNLLPGSTLAEKFSLLAAKLRTLLTTTPPTPEAQEQLRTLQDALNEARRMRAAELPRVLLDLLSAETNPQLWGTWGYQLSSIPMQETERGEFIQFRETAARDPDPTRRAAAMRLALQTGDPDAAFEEIWNRLVEDDPDESVRSAAAENAPRGNPACRARVLSVAERDRSDDVRMSAVWTLAEGATPQEQEALTRIMMYDRSPEIQHEALQALTEFASPRDTAVREAFLTVARDARKSAELRRAAVDSLLDDLYSGGSFVTDPAERRQLEEIREQLTEQESGQ